MRKKVIAAALCIAVIVMGVAAFVTARGARLLVVLPNAIGIVEGTPVQVAGFDVGTVTAISIRNGKAVLAVTVTDPKQPLRLGATATVEWRSLLGERYLRLDPGPSGNPPLPDGAMIEAGSAQVVVGDLLQTLDKATRDHLSSTIRQLDAALAGSQPDLNATLREAGPSVRAIGAVLDAIGSDGPAIKTVLANVHQVTSVLAERKDGLSTTVADLTRLTSTAAVHQRRLRDGLAALPDALASARTALDKVPAATEETMPLLEDLRPSAHRLPSVADNLSPVMRDLAPTLAMLGPTVEAADRLLTVTPPFLDTTTAVLPPLRTTIERVAPAVAFLRPYTPEIMGFLSNWGNLYSTYDAQGHQGHPIVIAGQTAFNSSPNLVTPGERVSSRVAPGAIVDQPWTDAYGQGPR